MDDSYILTPHIPLYNHTHDGLYQQPCSFVQLVDINPLNPELNPICCLLALLGSNHFLHFNRIRVKSLTLRLLLSYI